MIKQLSALLDKEFDPGFEARARFIFQLIHKNKPKYVLDAGCGRGFYSHAISFFSFIKKIESFDINESYLELAMSHCTDKRIHIQKANIFRLPYPDNYFDFIIFSEVLEHLSNEKKALQELRRVLKSGGKIALTVPNRSFPFLWDPLNWFLMNFFNTHISKDVWWLAGIWADHIRLYSVEDLLRFLNKQSFKIKSQKNIIHWSWPFAHFILYGVGKNIIERLGIYSVSRFEFTTQSMITRIIARIMRFPSSILDKRFPTSSSVNICVVLEK